MSEEGEKDNNEDGGGGSKGRFGGSMFRDGRSKGNAKMPYQNYLITHGVKGPWSGDPMEVSLYDAKLRKTKRGLQITEYPYKQHPTFLLHKKFEPAFSSQRKDEKKYVTKEMEESTKKIINRAVLSGAVIEPAPSEAETAAEAPPEASKKSKQENAFSNGNITWQKLKEEKPLWYYHVSVTLPREHLKDDAAHLLDFKSTPEANEFAIVVSFMLKAMSNLEMGLNKNDKEQEKINSTHFQYAGQLWPRLKFFVEIILTEDAGGLSRYLDKDPETELDAKTFVNPDPSIMHQLYSRENIVAFRFHWLIFDRKLHPATLMKAQIWKNKFEKNEIDYDRLTDLLNYHVQNEGYHTYVQRKDDEQRKLQEGKLKSDEERKKLADDRPKIVPDVVVVPRAPAEADTDDDDEEFVPACDAPPSPPLPEVDAAAAVVDDAPRVPGQFMADVVAAAEAVANGEEEEDEAEEGGDEEEEEEDDEDEEVSGIEEGEPLSEGEEERLADIELLKLEGKPAAPAAAPAPLDTEDISLEARIQKPKKGKKKGGDAEGDQEELRGLLFDSRSKKKTDNDPTRTKIADNSGEASPTTYYRTILDYARLSRFVFHTYNLAARTKASKLYPSGLYEQGDASIFLSKDYDLHNSLSPLFYVNTFCLHNANRVAQFNVPGHKGRIMPILPAQANTNNYFHGEKGYFSAPYPILMYEYDPTDSNPEFLATYRLPCGSSQLLTQIEHLEDRIANHARKLNEKKADGIDIGRFTNGCTQIFNNNEIKPKEESDIPAPIKVEKPGVFSTIVGVNVTPQVVPNAAAKQKEEPCMKFNNTALSAEALSRVGSSTRDRASTWSIMDSPALMSSETASRPITGHKRRHEDEAADVVPEEGPKNTKKVKTSDADLQEEQLARERYVTLDGIISAQASSTRKQPNVDLRLGALLAEATTTFGSSEFSQKINDIYLSKDESLKAMLDMVTKPGKDAPISPLMAREIRTDLVAFASSSKEYLKAKEDMLRKLGNPVEEVKRLLSTSVIQGPIAELRTTMAKLKYRLIRSVSTMPFKTETQHLAQWLQDSCGSKILTNRASDLEAAVLEEMTPLREEHYRRDQLSRMMAMFHQEAATATLSMLSLKNPNLPDVYRGILVYKEERKSDQFFVPRFGFDTSMERFANMIAGDMLETNVACSLSEGHLFMMELNYSFRINALRHAKPMPQGILVYGPPGTGKSNVLEHYLKTCALAAIQTSDHQSTLSSCVAKPHDYFQYYCDEGPAWVVGAVERMNAEGKRERDMRKGQFSRQENSFQRNVKGKNEEREKQSISASYIHQMIILTNRVEATRERSVLDRFRALMVCPPKRKQDSMADRVLASKFNFENNQEIADVFYELKKDEHYVIAIAVAMQNCFALPPTNTELLAVYMGEMENEIRSWIDYHTTTARSVQRCFLDAEAYTLARLHDRYLRSELSPSIEWSRDPKRDQVDGKSIVGIGNMNPVQMMDQFAPGLCVFGPEALFAMTNYFNERFPLRHYEIALIIAAEMFDFTPDFFLPSYQANKIKLPNVERRAKERGFGDSSPYEHCGFLKEYKKLVTTLTNRVAARSINLSNPMPKFSRVYESHLLDAVEGTDPVFLAGQAAAAELAVHKGKTPRSKEPRKVSYDPAILLFQGDLREFTKEALQKLKFWFPQLDDPTLHKVLSDLQNCNLSIPIYEYSERPTASSLRFKGVELDPTGNPFISKGKVEGLSYRSATAFDFLASAKTRPVVKISIDFLMKPWHEVLYLALSAPENSHTRSFDTVIPVQLRHHPELLHRWQSRPNPYHKVVINNPRIVPNRVASALTPGDYSECSHHLRASAIQKNHSQLDASNIDVSLADTDRDLEAHIFHRHLLSIYYQPYDYAKMCKAYPEPYEARLLVDWTINAENPDERMKKAAAVDPHAPGNAEKMILLRREIYPFFKKNMFKSLRYPDDIEHDLDVDRYKHKAMKLKEEEKRAQVEDYTQHQDQQQQQQQQQPLEEELTKDQLMELREWIEVLPDIGDEKRKQTLLYIDLWHKVKLDHALPPPKGMTDKEWADSLIEFKRQKANQATEEIDNMYWGMRLRKKREENREKKKKVLDSYLLAIQFKPAPPPVLRPLSRGAKKATTSVNTLLKAVNEPNGAVALEQALRQVSKHVPRSFSLNYTGFLDGANSNSSITSDTEKELDAHSHSSSFDDDDGHEDLGNYYYDDPDSNLLPKGKKKVVVAPPPPPKTPAAKTTPATIKVEKKQAKPVKQPIKPENKQPTRPVKQTIKQEKKQGKGDVIMNDHHSDSLDEN